MPPIAAPIGPEAWGTDCTAGELAPNPGVGETAGDADEDDNAEAGGTAALTGGADTDGIPPPLTRGAPEPAPDGAPPPGAPVDGSDDGTGGLTAPAPFNPAASTGGRPKPPRPDAGDVTPDDAPDNPEAGLPPAPSDDGGVTGAGPTEAGLGASGRDVAPLI